MKSENPEKRRTTDQRRAAVGHFIADHARMLAQKGHVARSWRQRRRLCGPYYRLAYEDEAGQQRSVYLGVDSELATQVRRQLAKLQEPAKERRQLAKARKAARQELRKAMTALGYELAKCGLELKGTEIRGWWNWTANNVDQQIGG
jgi:hypothetical protein